MYDLPLHLHFQSNLSTLAAAGDRTFRVALYDEYVINSAEDGPKVWNAERKTGGILDW